MSTALKVLGRPGPKQCIRCRNVFPCDTKYWEELDLRGEPVGQVCRVCKTPEVQAQYELERQKKENTREVVRQLISAARQNDMECPDFTALTATLMAELGGVKAFCTEWARILMKEELTTTKQKLEGFACVAKMVAASNQKAYQNVASMSDDELESELAAYLQSKLTVVRPDDGEPAAD